MSADASKTIDCTEAARRLWAFLDGELPEATAAEVSAHLDACAACLRVSEEQRRFLEAVSDLAPVEDDATAALRAKVRALLRGQG
jgi:anti-sigma factor (TIGR02949 family)